MNYTHYERSYFPVPFFRRTWPEKTIDRAPVFCSVDLRDGNQALTAPMTLEEKLSFFDMLCRIGFQQIETGFPAASETEYAFTRTLIEQDRIPDGVTIQVLSQIREHILRETFRAIDGAKSAIVHIYNSTSPIQREAVFGFSADDAAALAASGAKQCLALARTVSCPDLTFEYSPESFVATEPEVALSIVNTVIDTFCPTPEHKLIINLPETVQNATPNVYADMIEYMSQNMHRRDAVTLSVHTHNDRGYAGASSELALLAGAERVEGTLFGNGERTGNADLMTMALNLMAQGIDPTLDFSDLPKLVRLYEDSTKMLVPPRHPYAGELVFTAFSGSHQDAIRKGMDFSAAHPDGKWKNPYLPIDPADIGRKYDPIRINSQSGTGGILYILERKYGIHAPKALAVEFSHTVKDLSDRAAAELSPERVYEAFRSEYLNLSNALTLKDYHVTSDDAATHLLATFSGIIEGERSADGNGPLDALNNLVSSVMQEPIDITAYREHALEGSSSSEAMAFVAIRRNNATYWGAGRSTSINTASMRAYISAVNRSLI